MADRNDNLGDSGRSSTDVDKDRELGEEGGMSGSTSDRGSNSDTSSDGELEDSSGDRDESNTTGDEQGGRDSNGNGGSNR